MKNPSLADLLKKGDVRPFPAGKSEVEALLKLAGRDLVVAEELLKNNRLDWSLAVSYNCVLQTSRAWLFFKGYRPSYGEGHSVVIQFAMATLEQAFGKEIEVLDSLRTKRHAVVYEAEGETTEYEAGYALKLAKKFLEFMKKKIGE
ncbi:MAG TPA: HEPN domain-containing protein [Candidatus Norongarragalinales archaeon]|nr:HEPN domain-containing protein [Candidatus Norongarragalinales archaeon]